METVMNANESHETQHDESNSSESRTTAVRNDSREQRSKQEFSWYAGHVDERVLRVIVHMTRARKQ
jgi:hypothetical protein